MTMLEKITLIGLLGPLSVGRGMSTHADPTFAPPSAKGFPMAESTGEPVALAVGLSESQGSAGSTVGTAPAKASFNT